MHLLLLAVAIVAPAAKPGPVEQLRKVVVGAIRNCLAPENGEIVVCAPDRGVAEGYRLPRLDPRYAGSALRLSGRGTLPDVGATGTGSCSTVGGGGQTGCALAEANAWGAWKRERKRAGQGGFPW